MNFSNTKNFFSALQLEATALAVPEIGMGATIMYYTDGDACTVIEVNGKSITVQRDIAKRTDDNGMSDAQSYTYSPNPNGRKYVFTLRKNGKWIMKGHSLKNGIAISIGVRAKYYDFSL